MTLVTLRNYRGETVEISCRRCNKHAFIDRKALVKKFGAEMTFVQLRRVLSIGCEHLETNSCASRFPSLEAPER
jgi:hypothetical protein